MDRLLFFDIDGTLAMPGEAPGKETVRAIRSARAKGHRVFISTGRPEYSIPKEIDAIGFDGGIYCAGGKVVIHGETIFDRPMDQGLSAKVAEMLCSFNLSFNLECGAHNYRYEVPDEGLSDVDISKAGTELQRILKLDKNNPHVRTFQEYTGEPVYKISFRTPSRKRFEEIEDRLSELGKAVSFDNLKPDIPLLFCEFSDSKINKGNALAQVCQYYGMDTDRSIAFGDSMNDAEILRAAGIGVAMGNSETRLKAIADRVCESCGEDGVAKELVRLGVI